MTDLDALRDLIRADSATRGQPISRLGYFCAPFRPKDGPFADRVIKVYRGLRDPEALDRLAARVLPALDCAEASYRERAGAAYAAYLDYLIESGPILQLILRERHQDSPLGAESQRQFRRLLRRVAEDTRRALSLAPREAFVLLELTAGIPEALARLVRGGEIDRETAHATCRRLVTASVDGFAVAPAS